MVDRALTLELRKRGRVVEDQKRLNIYYDGKVIGTYVPDKIIDGKVLVEVKCKELLTQKDIDQFWKYLKGSRYTLGLLVNFGPRRLEIRRIVYDEARKKDQRMDRRVRSASDPRSVGFTLVEAMIATALLAIVFVAGFDLLWQVLSVQSKTLAVQEVQQNARIALRRIETETRNASGVTLAASVFGANPGKLTLDYPGTGTDVVLDTATSTTTVGGVSVPYRMLRVSVGSDSPLSLTNDRVNVTKFLLTNLTHGQTPPMIRIDIDVQMLNPGGDANRNASFALSSSVSLRR